MGVFGVYGLVDPRTLRTMYVGKSTDIRRRYRQHVDGRDCDHNIERYKWIQQLRENNLTPTLVVLLELPADSYAELDAAEQRIIREHKVRGEAELNKSIGGSSRAVSATRNSSQDEWLELGSTLLRVRAEVDAVLSVASRIGAARDCDKLLKAFRLIDSVRFDLGIKLEKTFPEWVELQRVFFDGAA